MLALRRPDDAALARFVAEARESSLTYESSALEDGGVPSGWDLDHHRVELGDGPAAFACAKEALERWAQFELGWVELFPRDARIAVGTDVAVLVRVAGVVFVNAARIVRVVDEPARFGFAYGTLARHAECGEESFTVELDAATGRVWYDVRARSRPRRLWVRLGRPWVRRLQRRFALDSLAAMQRAVGGERTEDRA